MSILAIREILESGNAHQAERQLARIAHDQGDAALSIIVGELTPHEVASFLEEGDYSKPSEVVPYLSRDAVHGGAGSLWLQVGEAGQK